jgi:hypothetical protein
VRSYHLSLLIRSHAVSFAHECDFDICSKIVHQSRGFNLP